MSKVNVNPNHYKVAGRERQGEGILQERHRQKLANSRALERFERPRGISPSPAATAPAALVPGPPPPGPSATSTAKRAPARKRTSSSSSSSKTGRGVTTASRADTTRSATTASPSETKRRATTAARSKTTRAVTTAARSKTTSGRSISTNLQASDKRGKRSTAQKRAASRHDFESMPATRQVAGAFGRERSPGGGRKKR